MRATLLLPAFLLAAAAPAGAQERPTVPPALTATLSLGGGAEVGSEYNGLGELELTLGYETGALRPELGVLVGLAPGSYAGFRPGVHVALDRWPVYVRGALDFANARDGWAVRWLLAGAGVEARVTSELGAFAEVDLGIPLGRDFGVPALARAGFSLRF